MARDIIHDAIVEALDNDGWKIIDEEFRVDYKELTIFVDIVAERKPLIFVKDNRKIIVEVKSFMGRHLLS